MGAYPTIAVLLEKAVEKAPDKTYLFFEDQEIDYQTFDSYINRAAHGFLRLGVGKSDRVCLTQVVQFALGEGPFQT